MRKKIERNYKGLALWLVIGLLGVFTLSGIVLAYSGGSPRLVIENFSGIYNEASLSEAVGSLLGGTTNLDSLELSENLTVAGTATLNEIALSSDFQTSLDLSATSTSPGAAGSITIASDSVCNVANLDISTGSTAGGRTGVGSPFGISVSVAAALGGNPTAFAIATTTIATTTAPLISSSAPFRVDAGQVVQVSFNGITGDPATSTAALPGADAGNLLLSCHNR